MLFFAPPPPPVSFSTAVAPILAMRCNSCHGDAGGLDTRTHAGLMAGGNLGKVVIPGDAERSLLVHFIEGRRGEVHRMPLGGRPLSQEEIGIIRRWIDDGARPDSVSLPRQVSTLNSISLPRGKPLRLFFKVSSEAYLTLTIRDPRSRGVLLSRVATVKSEREQGDAGAPDELLHWDIRAGKGWPKTIDAELTAEHGTTTLRGTQFYVAATR